MITRIKDKKLLKRLLLELSEDRAKIAYLLVSSSPRVPSFIDKTINQIAESFNLTVEETLVKVLSANHGQAIVFDQDVSGEQLATLLKHPFSFIASDSVGYKLKPSLNSDLPHPRCFGTFPRFLRLVRGSEPDQQPLLPWAEAISKITARPAQFLGLKDRGYINKGMAADVVIFDKAAVTDMATYSNPYKSPRGVRYVINNGKIAVFDGQLTGITAGKFIKG